VLPPLRQSLHNFYGQPVVRRVLLPGGVQDSTGAAFAQEARNRQGADVQLPANIQPDNHLKGDRTAGAKQAAATPALRTSHDCSQRTGVGTPQRRHYCT